MPLGNLTQAVNTNKGGTRGKAGSGEPSARERPGRGGVAGSEVGAPMLYGMCGSSVSCPVRILYTVKNTRNFYLHHTRLITKAAVIHDAMGIREQVHGLRQRVCAAHAAASGWP